LLGSVFMLIAILMLYFASDLKQLSDSQLIAAHAVSSTAEEQATQIADLRAKPGVVHTFNILALQQMGQHTELFDGPILWGKSLQWWAFLLLLLGFVIKVPSVPLHTWLPDAHVEAPTPISMILAGVLLKMGGYGIIRICYPICPHAGYDLAYFVCTLGVVSMVYGAFAALAQKDFKRLVAYSSVSHMGYVVLGIGVWSAVAGYEFNPDAWKMGMNGAMFQMLAHGISSPAMFFMVGVIYDRVHHRNLDQFGGLFARMPVYSGLAIGIFFAGLGLPGLCGFIGEVFVTLSVWKYNQALAVISASVVILTAAYILWTLQRVYLGPEYKGPHGDHLHAMSARELAIAAPLLALAIVFGVYPQAIFRYMTPSVDRTVDDLTSWTRRAEPAQTRQTAETGQPPQQAIVHRDARAFSDKIARHPELLGVHGAVTQEPTVQPNHPSPTRGR
ncbi:MAG TPA: NADH-quinone oxidoreductase subunit M, partial [Pirellulales bacterium]|nr:NADH-quinone oxidoreductase subunit M [Pirellulales bacterium]